MKKQSQYMNPQWMITAKDTSKEKEAIKTQSKQSRSDVAKVPTTVYLRFKHNNTRLKFFPVATYLPGLL